jgi:LysR family transcriptional regulator, benzoate and cis,cis-muconate-responsive activator of ben and cat genes
MDIRQLRYFIAVAEEENVGRAAKRLCISQPPLSRQIHDFERDLDAQLFTRTVRGVELTEIGAIVLADARNIVSLMEQMVERTRRAKLGQLGRLDIGLFGSTVLGIVPTILQRFHADNPDVKVVIHTMNRKEQIESLLMRRIGVGFNRFVTAEPGIAVETILREPVLVALPDDHRLAQQRAVSLSDLAHEPLILFPAGERMNFIDVVIGLFKSAGIEPKIAQEVGDAVAGLALISSGFGIALIAQSATMLTAKGVVYKNLDTKEPALVDLSCLYLEDNTSSVVNLFLQTVREVAHGAQSNKPARKKWPVNAKSF